MKVLRRSQQVLTWLCVCPVNETEDFKAKYILFTFGVLATLIFALASSIVFCLKFASSKLEQAFHALFVIAALTAVVIANIIMFVMRSKMIGIFGKLSEIYETSKTLFCLVWKDQIWKNENYSKRPNFSLIKYFCTLYSYKILNLDKNEETYQFLLKVDNLCNWLWEMYFYMMGCYFISSMMMCAISVVVCNYLTGSFDANHVLHPFRLVSVNNTERIQ